MGVAVAVGSSVAIAVDVGVAVADPGQAWAGLVEAVAIRPFSVHTRLLPLNRTLKTPTCRPGWNTVGCPRSAGLGLNLFCPPTGMATGPLLSFL
jgi:hypothetical protein